jgi:CheY-like chemotaxis protein
VPLERCGPPCAISCTVPRSLRILYVEDDRQIRQLVQESLELAGWTVEAVADGLTAFSSLERHDPHDLLLTDYELPGLNGIELVRRTRQITHRQGILVILYSGSPVQAEALAAGADAFLRKPEDIARIVERISQLHGSAGKTE